MGLTNVFDKIELLQNAELWMIMVGSIRGRSGPSHYH